MDELGLERRERDGHGRGHRRLEGRQGHDQGDRGRQERERHGDGHGRAEAADDGVVQAGVVVEDREGALQGERQVDGLGPADDRGVWRLVQVHDPGHRRRAGAHGVHEWFRVGQQFRQGLLRVRIGRFGVRREDVLQGPVVRHADDGVVQAGVVVEDREGALQGERQVDGLGPADDRGVWRLVQVHDPGHRRRAGAHGVHEWFRVGQQFRQGLHGVWRQCRCGRRAVRSGRHTKLHHNQQITENLKYLGLTLLRVVKPKYFFIF